MVNDKKFGALRTGFTVMKSYLASAMLFLPHQFLISGWLFMLIACLFSMVMNMQSAILLIELHDAVGGSFADIAERAYGKRMKVVAEVTLAIAQISFCYNCVYFLVSQFGGENGVL